MSKGSTCVAVFGAVKGVWRVSNHGTDVQQVWIRGRRKCALAIEAGDGIWPRGRALREYIAAISFQAFHVDVITETIQRVWSAERTWVWKVFWCKARPCWCKWRLIENFGKCNMLTHRVMRIADSWHCGACVVVACKEFYKPDECHQDEVRWQCCSGYFPVIMARRAPRRHVMD